MYGLYFFTIIFLILMVLTILGFIFFSYPKNKDSNDNYIESDIEILKEVMTYDSYLNRLLMIEIINNIADVDSLNLKINNSHKITHDKIIYGMELFGRSLISSFGGDVSKRISSLMIDRNLIIKDYYQSLKNISSDKKSHIKNIDNHQYDSTINSSIEILSDVGALSSPSIFFLDLTTTTLKKLEKITTEILELISSFFSHDESTDRNPLIHCNKLYDLIILYNKEILNQAKSYANNDYTISINCFKSLLTISKHIAEEFSILIYLKNSKLKVF